MKGNLPARRNAGRPSSLSRVRRISGRACIEAKLADPRLFVETAVFAQMRACPDRCRAIVAAVRLCIVRDIMLRCSIGVIRPQIEKLALEVLLSWALTS